MDSHIGPIHSTSASSSQLALLVKLIQDYTISEQAVRDALTKLCKAFKENVPSCKLCLSLLQTLAEMNSPLALLCTLIEELMIFPIPSISLPLSAFMDLCTLQQQTLQVEQGVKKCYTYLLESALHHVTELRAETMEILQSLRTQLGKVRRFLQALISQSQLDTASPLGIEGTLKETDIGGAGMVPLEPPSLTPQKQAPSNSSRRLAFLKNALMQYEENQAFIKWKQTAYFDPRNVPQDLLYQEELIKQKIEEIQRAFPNSETLPRMS